MKCSHCKDTIHDFQDWIELEPTEVGGPIIHRACRLNYWIQVVHDIFLDKPTEPS